MSRVRSFSVPLTDTKAVAILAKVDEHRNRKRLEFSAVVIEALQLYCTHVIEKAQPCQKISTK